MENHDTVKSSADQSPSLRTRLMYFSLRTLLASILVLAAALGVWDSIA
jgi:hypothetical protein